MASDLAYLSWTVVTNMMRCLGSTSEFPDGVAHIASSYTPVLAIEQIVNGYGQPMRLQEWPCRVDIDGGCQVRCQAAPRGLR